MALGFTDLEKAYDTGPREMALATLIEVDGYPRGGGEDG